MTDAPTVPVRSRPAPRRVTGYIPPQHGAWAFLVVPLLVGYAVAGWNWAGVLFGLAWIVAYPVSYFGGRAVTARVRRGSWTRLARREAGRAVPWLVALVLLGLPLLVHSPWLLAALAVLLVAGAGSLALAARFGERSMANDLALVGQAVCAVPLLWAVVADSGGIPGVAPGPLWTTLAAAPTQLAVATVAVAGYLLGSVLAVKSVLREAANPAFRRFTIGYHVLLTALAIWANPLWLLGFGPALARSILLRAGMKPAAIGGVETIVAAMFVVSAFLALD